MMGYCLRLPGFGRVGRLSVVVKVRARGPVTLASLLGSIASLHTTSTYLAKFLLRLVILWKEFFRRSTPSLPCPPSARHQPNAGVTGGGQPTGGLAGDGRAGASPGGPGPTPLRGGP